MALSNPKSSIVFTSSFISSLDDILLSCLLCFISSPSTSFQFTSNEKKFKLDLINPGYLVVTLKENGGWHVSCQRVAGEFGTPEANPKTY